MSKRLPLKRIRYYTMNSWNRETAPAYNMKIYNLISDKELRNKLYDLIQLEDAYDNVNTLIDNFEYECKHTHGYEYRAFFNGHNDGYLVLGNANNNATVTDEEVPAVILKLFRQLALDIQAEAIWLAENAEIKEEEIQITKTVRKLYIPE